MHKEILLLGNPLLRVVSKTVNNFADNTLKEDINVLKETLENFRAQNGFGRGIAAIQVGIARRMIALNLGEGTFVILNPVITRRSSETFRLWDDCMSFPDLVVRVSRYKSVDVQFDDEEGNRRVWRNADQAISELLQHEIDHLDGILATDRAIGPEDMIYKSEYNRNKIHYDRLVDYVIQPTIKKS